MQFIIPGFFVLFTSFFEHDILWPQILLFFVDILIFGVYVSRHKLKCGKSLIVETLGSAVMCFYTLDLFPDKISYILSPMRVPISLFVSFFIMLHMLTLIHSCGMDINMNFNETQVKIAIIGGFGLIGTKELIPKDKMLEVIIMSIIGMSVGGLIAVLFTIMSIDQTTVVRKMNQRIRYHYILFTATRFAITLASVIKAMKWIVPELELFGPISSFMLALGMTISALIHVVLCES